MARRAGLTLDLNNYAQFSRELSNLDRTISSIDRRIDRIGDAFDKMEREAKQSSNELRNTSTQTQNVARDIDKASRDIENSASRLDRMADSFNKIGGALTVGFSVPFAAIKQQGVAAASAFEDALVDLQTRANLTTDEMARIQVKALEIGRDTQFSAQQGADAFLQLLTSGQDVEEAFATVDSVITGAAASGESLGTVSDALTDIMAAFNLEATESENVLEGLVDASGASSATFNELIQGFQNVGGIAREFGLSTRETSAVLALFAENGIKGAEAGTQLRSMLNNMTRDTDEVVGIWNELNISMYDLQGNVRPLNDVMDDLRVALDGTTEQDRIRILKTLGGSYGQLGLSALTSGEGIEDMLDKMEESGDAGDIAAAKMSTLSGAFAFLRGSIESTLIKAFLPFNEQAVKPFVLNMANAVNAISAWIDRNPELTTQLLRLGSILAAVGPALLLFEPIIGVIGAIGSALSFALSPAVIVTIGAIALAINDITNNVGGAGDALDDLVNSFVELFTSIRGIATQIGLFITNFVTGGEQVERAWSPITFILRSIQVVVDSITSGLQKVEGVLTLLNATQLSGVTPKRSEAETNALLREREAILTNIADLEFEYEESANGRREILVEEGDTLYDLANQYGTTVDNLRELNNLKPGDFILTGQTLKISSDTELSDEYKAGVAARRDELRQQLTEIDSQLNQTLLSPLDAFLKQFSETTLFEKMFGTDDGALDRARITIDGMRVAAGQLKDNIDLVKTGFSQLLSGDYETGFDTLKTAIQGVYDTLGDIADVFAVRNSGSELVELNAAGLVNIETGTTNPIVQGIQRLIEGVRNFDFTESKQLIADNIDSILKAGIAIAGILFGGVTSVGIGIGTLILKAIESDFLGIRTQLETSGVLPAFREGMATLKQAVTDIGNTIFGAGASETGDLAASGLVTFEQNTVVDTIATFFNSILTGLKTISDDPLIDVAISTLESIRDGIAGFIEAIAGTNTDAFGDAASTIGDALDIMFNALAILGSGVIAGFFDTLPAIGETLSSLFESVSLLLAGNPELALESFFDAIQSGLESLKGLTVGTVDKIIEFFNTVTGLNIPDLSTIFDSIGTAVESFLNSPEFQAFVNNPIVQEFVDVITNLGSGIEGFATGLSETIDLSLFTNFVQDLLNLPLVKGSIDFIIGFFGAFASILSLIGGGVLNGIGDALGPFGAAIGDLFNVIGNLVSGEGSFGGAVQSFLSMLNNLFQGIIAIPTGIMDKLIEFFNAAFGTDFPAISNLGNALTDTLRQMGVDIDAFLLKVENAILALRIAITKGGVATGTATEQDLQGLLQRQLDVNVEQELQNQLNRATQSGDIGLNLPISVDFEGRTFDNTLLSLLEQQDFVDQLTPATRDLIQQAFDQLPADQQQVLIELDTIQFDLSKATPTIAQGPQPFDASGFDDGNLFPTTDDLTGDETSPVGNLFGAFDAFTSGLTVGQDINAGLSMGLSENETVTTAATTTADSTLGAFRNAFGIYSPSLVMQEIGGFMMQGLTLGIQNGAGPVFAVIAAINANITSSLSSMANTFTARSFQMVTAARLIQNAVQNLQRAVIALKREIESVNNLNIKVDGKNPVPPEGRYFGGPVNKGQIVEYNEGNLPFEIFQTGGKNYLLPNQAGRFLSPANALYTPAPQAAGVAPAGGGGTTHYNQITVQIPATVTNAADISPEVIADGIVEFQERRSPQRRNRGNA